jgi:benzoyl-CoA reductase/2-hydroxyglutaryl-CoA dehydratase subunit BcrC/BadD/HgdB
MSCEKVGITGTLPVEAIFAAGLSPVDLNNAFIASSDPASMVDEAERRGMPQNACAWIKGIYIAARRLNLRRVVGVTGGDCTNTRALLEIWQSEGIETLEFSFPYPPDTLVLEREIETFCRKLGTTVDAAEQVRESLLGARRLAAQLDRLTWQEGKVTGRENHLFLVGMSDFEGDWRCYEARLRDFVASAACRPGRTGPRLGIMGVPPILADLHDFIESRRAMTVFNEFQRQFAMPYPAASLAEQYTLYTYPYGTAGRLADVVAEVAKRRINGIIHYVQSFCWRQIADRLIREALPVPVLTLQADRPGAVSGQLATRIEAFLEMIG